ncbi:50S ribosomal protein L24e [Salinirubellus salinus]|uniref:Large ribosomal subunit protein eL24 n=1 Tax=Salinirubellus salinus TaxID=1364945 RepID=A0A9E7R6X0_9EURY|nr:50S ribosomal protein L24e [Salinirubellus salinus]UWM55793.1 50S ribosomal protein L24e [Salinirubellus salinus]
MVQKRTCDYTGEDIEPGTGIMYVANDGTILHFVDSKAEKNYLMGREARDLEWTSAGRANKGPAQEQVEAEPEPEPVEETETEEEAAEGAAPDLEAVEEDAEEVQDDAEAVDADVDEGAESEEAEAETETDDEEDDEE